MERSADATAGTHIFVEDRDLDCVCSLIRASRHIKYTSVAASTQLLLLGTSNGMVLVFLRDSSLRQLLLIRAAGQSTQSACSITLLRVTCDEKRVAASRSDGGVSVIDLSTRLKAQPSVTDLLAGRQRTRITDIVWNASGSILYVGDEEGVIHGFNSSVTAIFSSVVELLRVDSSVVQLDCVGETLLISTLTRCYLFNVTSKVKTTIGRQLRNGNYGACFLRLPDVDTPNIYCARRKGRIWEADFKGSVLNTHELQESSPTSPAPVFSYRSGQAREDRKSNSLDGLASEEQPDVITADLKFNRLFSFGSKYLLARSDSHICIVDPIAARLILWTDCFKGVVDIFCIKEDMYIISSNGDQLHEVHFNTISGYIESSLPLFQPILTTSQYGGRTSSIVRAIACCHVCISGSAVLKEMLSAGRLRQDLLRGLYQILGQSTADEPYWSVSTSLTSKLSNTFIEWLDGESSEASLTLNVSSHLPSRQSSSSDLGLDDVDSNGRTAAKTAVLTKADASHRALSSSSEIAASLSDSQSGMCNEESSFQDDAVSFDRVSTSDSLVQDDTNRDTESIVSFPESELSVETSSDQLSTQDLVFSEKAETPPSAMSSGASFTFRRLFPPAAAAAGSPIDTFLVAKDKFSSIFGSLLSRPKGQLEHGRGRSASSFTDQEPPPQYCGTAESASTGSAGAGSADSALAQQSGLQELLQQTRHVHAAVRSACGLAVGGEGGGRQELLQQLSAWSDCLLRAHNNLTTAAPPATAAQHGQPASSCAGELPPSWRTQPVNVSCPWPLVDDARRELVSAAMLYIELGCPATAGCRRNASVNGECNSDGLLTHPDHSVLPPRTASGADGAFGPAEPAGRAIGDTGGEADRPDMAAASSRPDIDRDSPHGSASDVTEACRFMRQFFFLTDIKRLAAWIARLPDCGGGGGSLQCWTCFVECLEEVTYHKDQGTTMFHMSSGESLPADETLHRVLMLAKHHGTAASAVNSITSDAIATQVFLLASRFIVLHPDKVVAFCAELRQLVHPTHVRNMVEINHMDPRHFVVYMDKVLQGLANSETRDAFVQEQCRMPALRVYWLLSLLASDCRHLAAPVLSGCCGMIRPMSLGAVWPHKNLLDNLLAACLQQNEDSTSGLRETAITVGDLLNRSITGLLKENGYWSGCLVLWRSQQRQTDEVLKCLLQNGDSDCFERETELMNLSAEEWTKVFRFRKVQEPEIHDVEQQPDPTVAQAPLSCDGGHSASDTGGLIVTPAPSDLSAETRSCGNISEPSPAAATAAAATPRLLTACLYCGKTMEAGAPTIRWDDLLLLFVKRHGLSKMWPLVHEAVLPHDVFTFSFYKSCLYMARAELQQTASVEKIMEVMNSYLWSRRPNYGSPAVRYLVDRQQVALSSGSEQEAISAQAAKRHASTIHSTPRVLLDDAACHWGALLDRASTKCPLCARHILSNPSGSGDAALLVFDCAHVYHRHCLLDDRGCPLCISASSSASQHSLRHSSTLR